MSSLPERLIKSIKAKEIRDGRTISPADISRAIKVSEAAVSLWLNDGNGIGAINARKLASYLDVDALWLETGKDQPQKPSRLSLVADLPTTGEVAEMVALFLESESGTRRLILNTLRGEHSARILSQKSIVD